MNGECHCCGYATELTVYPGRSGDDRHLCDLCAGSMAGVSHEYKHPDLRLQQTICYVGNAILDAVRNGRGGAK